MWVLYVVWAFSAPEESRIGVYVDSASCQTEVAVLKKDDRIAKARCELRENFMYEYK